MCAHVEANYCLEIHKSTLVGFYWFKKFFWFFFSSPKEPDDLDGRSVCGFRAVACWGELFLGLELDEILKHLWHRLEGRGSDRWEAGETVLFFCVFFGWERRRGPS